MINRDLYSEITAFEIEFWYFSDINHDMVALNIDKPTTSHNMRILRTTITDENKSMVNELVGMVGFEFDGKSRGLLSNLSEPECITNIEWTL